MWSLDCMALMVFNRLHVGIDGNGECIRVRSILWVPLVVGWGQPTMPGLFLLLISL